jgi:cation transport regulator ChaC
MYAYTYLAQRGTLLQPGRTLKDYMTQGYVYIILVDTVTREYVEIAQKEYEEMKKKKYRHARTRRNRAKSSS